MPGIVAIISAERQDSVINKSLLRDMASSITHENWQKTDVFFRHPLFIARIHLGIVNTEQQPIFNEDKSICIFMDGEVFGYDEEKRKLERRGHRFEFNNDPEFCLHLFEEYGEAFVEKLDGSFVLVIFDLRNEKILIANDKNSFRPLFYTKNDDRYIFSSEVKAILRDKTTKKDVDDEAVACFFAFGRILVEEKTFFKNIKLIPPGSTIIWSTREVVFKRYWNINYREEYKTNLTEEYYVDALVNLWLKAIEKRTRGKHRFGVFLSGGLDSRAVATSVAKRCYPIHTFTYGVAEGDEAKIAERVAKKLEAQHEFLELKSNCLKSFAEEGVYLTDGMDNCANFYWLYVMRAVRKHADIVFHGHGQDILLGALLYRVRSTQIFLDNEILKAEGDNLTALLYKKLNSLIPEDMMPRFFSKAYYQKIRSVPFRLFKKALDEISLTNVLNKTDCFYLRSMTRDYWGVILLRNFAEDRVVGLDSDLLEFAVGIPPRFRTGQNLYYKFLEKLSPDMARIPYQKTGFAPRMPMLAHCFGFLIKVVYKTLTLKITQNTAGIISLPMKMGYPDIDEWIRNQGTGKYFKDILLSERTLSRGYFNREALKKMIDEHMSRSKDWGTQLCALLTFELWNRLFIDESIKDRVNHAR